MTAINRHDDTFRDVRQFQFRQRLPGRVDLLIRVGPAFTEENRMSLAKSLQKTTVDDIDYTVQIVEQLDETVMGKGVYLKQEIPGLTV